jgi:accessory gene regulator B
MIDAVAAKLAAQIKRTVPDHPRSESVLAFSILFLLNTTLIIVLSLLISFFTGRIWETIEVLVSFAVLRQISGGYHFKSGTLCVLVSTIGAVLLSLTAFGTQTVLVMNLISVALVLVYSPSRLEGTRIPVRYYPLLKVLSFLIVCSNFIFQSPVLAASFLVQSLTLIRKRW